MSKPRCGIIQFPGSNCELETQYAFQFFGWDAMIFRWNTPLDVLSKMDAYVLPGGFSYQDRVRAGAIAAKMEIMELLIDADKWGKPILGICNGCQILAEAGVIPNTKGEYELEAALAPNTRGKEPIGFICDWVWVTFKNTQKSLFTTLFNEGDALPIPINHGEGRFLLKKSILDSIESYSQIQFCTSKAEVLPSFPVNPNGSMLNLAGFSNKKGNVLAIMPHPERACFLKQIPFWIPDPLADEKREHFKKGEDGVTPWKNLFIGMREYALENREQWARNTFHVISRGGSL